VEDWDLVWTVTIDRGKIAFQRRPAKHPDLTISWQTANEFLSCARESASPESRLELAGNIELRRVASNLLKSFLSHLGHVLRNPVDGAGESLL
jgi:predicted lipid carrier protein YhbT